jgi:hypothetical protein
MMTLMSVYKNLSDRLKLHDDVTNMKNNNNFSDQLISHDVTNMMRVMIEQISKFEQVIACQEIFREK